MKNYFDFTLTGKRLFPVWILFYLLIIIPYAYNYYLMNLPSPDGKANTLSSLFVFLIMIVGYLAVFYIIKMILESVKYKEDTVQFEGGFLTYVGKMLLGIFLTMVTASIYMAWFIKDITKFFTNNSTLNGERFQFKGKGLRLFIILLLTMMIPMILMVLYSMNYLNPTTPHLLSSVIFQGFFMILLIPYFYFAYKWMVDMEYKGYSIKWRTSFSESFVKILIEMLLTIITLGIYLPMAYLRLFDYFSSKTFAESENATLQFGFDYNAQKDFFFIWGQILLSIITLGIYYPWSISKIGKRYLSQTYVINVNAE